MDVNYQMNNAEMLQKLINGTEETQTIEIEYNGGKAEFTIRPLTAGELTKLQVIEKQGFKVKVGMANGKRQTVESNLSDIDVNVGEFNEAQAEAMYKAISLSFDLSIDDIKNLPVGLPEVMFTKVIEISNLSDKDLTIVKNFR